MPHCESLREGNKYVWQQWRVSCGFTWDACIHLLAFYLVALVFLLLLLCFCLALSLCTKYCMCLCEFIYDTGFLSKTAIWDMGVGIEGVVWVEKFYYSCEYGGGWWAYHKQTASFRKGENSFVCVLRWREVLTRQREVLSLVCLKHTNTDIITNLNMCALVHTVHSTNTELHASSNQMRCGMVRGCILKGKRSHHN